jgi:hypothetical protein
MFVVFLDRHSGYNHITGEVQVIIGSKATETLQKMTYITRPGLTFQTFQTPLAVCICIFLAGIWN